MSNFDMNFFKELDTFHLNSNNRKDYTKVLNILDENFLEITSRGKIKVFTDYISADSFENLHFEILDYEAIKIDENTVLSIYTLKNTKTGVETLRSNLWKKIDGTWKMIFHQGTIIEK